MINHRLACIKAGKIANKELKLSYPPDQRDSRKAWDLYHRVFFRELRRMTEQGAP